jgi:heme-degrading monooxygenase HmoA
MVLEIARFSIVPGQEDDFAAAYAHARELLVTSPGCRTIRMTRGIESPSTFVLMVEWDSLDAHEVGFRQSERFPAWRALIGPYFAEAPAVEHYTDL